MDFGAFTSGLLTGLREGVEAALILAIICAYLAKTGNRRYFPRVFVGAGLALGLSAILGIALFATVGSFEEPYEQLFEGLTMVAAAAVVTWMLFWMRRQAASVKGELQAAVDRAIDHGSVTALAILAFIAVIREGIETALFLTGQVAATSSEGGAASVLVGALIGLAIAALLGVGFYQGSRRLNLATFFRWTGVALVFIAAGLLSHAVHEFIEIGVITFGTQTLFDISAVLPHEGDGSVLGQMLRALFGYTSSPEVTTFVVWLTYVVVVLALYLRPIKRPPLTTTSRRPYRPGLTRRLRTGRSRPRSGRIASRPNRKIVPTKRLNSPATAPTATYSRSRAWLDDEADRADQDDDEVRDEQADDEGEEHRDAEPGARGATDRGDEQHLGPGLGTDAVDHPDAERGSRAVGAHLERLDVFVAVDPRLEPTPPVADRRRTRASSGCAGGTARRRARSDRSSTSPTGRARARVSPTIRPMIGSSHSGSSAPKAIATSPSAMTTAP